MAAAGALRNQDAHVAQRLNGRIILGLGVGGAKFARKQLPSRTWRAKARQKPLRSAEFRHGSNTGTLNPLVMESMAGAKGSIQSIRRLRERYPAKDLTEGLTDGPIVPARLIAHS